MSEREGSAEARAVAASGDAGSVSPTIHTDFELPIYADATLAGLTPLVPVPLVDWWLEARFQRQMAVRIAQHRGRKLAPEVRRALDSGGRSLLVAGLLFLLKLPLRLLLRLVRKLVYVLAVKEATEKLSYYWQRAFLIDHMLLAGHLEDGDSARRAQQAMQRTLEGVPSPLTALAGQLAQRVWRLRPFRRQSSAEQLSAAAAEQRGFVDRHWAAYEGFLLQLAERYDQAYEALRAS
jgi:hypothetical protein